MSKLVHPHHAKRHARRTADPASAPPSPRLTLSAALAVDRVKRLPWLAYRKFQFPELYPTRDQADADRRLRAIEFQKSLAADRVIYRQWRKSHPFPTMHQSQLETADFTQRLILLGSLA